ncbi:hypothetical protein ACFQ34_13010 [Pseudonocardia benzenivorans]|uniref:DNA primase n=1 Tax=Pseudonocardia benzenivorans TaxID=228005 RepID=A0ABW3VGA5_9PSEU
MKCGARVALGVAGGYFLGRTKKMKLALMLGGMAAGRRAGGPGELLAQGSKLLNSSPELAALTDQVRGRLLEAGKGAAMAVAARQVANLTDKVGKRVESLGDVGSGARSAGEDAVSSATDAASSARGAAEGVVGRRRRRGAEADDAGSEDTGSDDTTDDEPVSDEPVSDEDVSDEPVADEAEDGDDLSDDVSEDDERAEDEDDRPAPRRRRSAKAAGRADVAETSARATRSGSGAGSKTTRTAKKAAGGATSAARSAGKSATSTARKGTGRRRTSNA